MFANFSQANVYGFPGQPIKKNTLDFYKLSWANFGITAEATRGLESGEEDEGGKRKGFPLLSSAKQKVARYQEAPPKKDFWVLVFPLACPQSRSKGFPVKRFRRLFLDFLQYDGAKESLKVFFPYSSNFRRKCKLRANIWTDGKRRG